MSKALVTIGNIVFLALLPAIAVFFVLALAFLLQGDFDSMFDNIFNLLGCIVGLVFVASVLPKDY